MGLMVLQLKQRVVLLPAMILALIVAAVFAPQKWQDRMNLTSSETTLDKSAHSRINAWNFSWSLAKDYPITGGGFDTFTKELFDRYAPNAKDVHGPHSVYFGVLAEHGFVGLFLYMTLVASCFFSVWRIRKVAHRMGDELVANYANMFQFSLIGFLVSGLFLGRAYFDYYFTLVCFIVVLKRVAFASWNRENRLVSGQPMDQEDEAHAEAVYAS